MIDKQTLKKHNLKAVPFSCIGEGQTFNVLCDIHEGDLGLHERRLVGDHFEWADRYPSPLFTSPAGYRETNETVYVPVWRPCGEVAK
jgi:hypothetical protein